MSYPLKQLPASNLEGVKCLWGTKELSDATMVFAWNVAWVRAAILEHMRAAAAKAPPQKKMQDTKERSTTRA